MDVSLNRICKIFCYIFIITLFMICLHTSANITPFVPQYVINSSENGWQYTFFFSPEKQQISGPSGLYLVIPSGYRYKFGSILPKQVRYREEDNQLSIAVPDPEDVVLTFEGSGTGTLTGVWVDYVNQVTLPLSPVYLEKDHVEILNTTDTLDKTQSVNSVITPASSGFTLLPVGFSLFLCVVIVFMYHRRRS